MKKTIVFALIVFGMAAANSASADNVRGIDINFVTIGHTNNLGDTRPKAYPSGSGAVGYNYRIGTKEITANQWQTINTAAGIDDSYDWSGNQPVAGISWYSAARFCNYLTSGNKSIGAYQIGTDGSITVDRAAAISAYGTIYVLPTEDEWYKAAYFKPDGSGYSTFANGEESIPPADDGWNYYGGAYSTPWNIGTGTMEQNGTFDMMGNVWEWNETPISSGRGIRGGSYNVNDYTLASSFRLYDETNVEADNIGFRIASIPEPATICLIGIGGLALLRKRRAE